MLARGRGFVPRLLRGSGDPLPSGLKHDVIRDPVPLDDSILIVFRLPAAFECPEPADREQAKSARVAIRPKSHSEHVGFSNGPISLAQTQIGRSQQGDAPPTKREALSSRSIGPLSAVAVSRISRGQTIAFRCGVRDSDNWKGKKR